jgi:hypothetical protein
LVGTSPAQAIQDIGNGGGGVLIDGEHLTFYSASIPLEKATLDRDQIPGMNLLLQNISSLSLSPSLKTQLNLWVLPTAQRRYFKGDDTQITAKQRRDLVRVYARLMHIPENKVALFALTNPDTKETVLLPDFFELKSPTAQAAVLFHESLWLSSTGPVNYASVVAGEQTAQAYFENAQDGKKYYAFYNMLAGFLKDPSLPLRAAFYFDQGLKLPWSLGKDQNRLLLTDLLGENFVRCHLQGRFYLQIVPLGQPEICGKALLGELIPLSQRYPESLFVKTLIDSLSQGFYISLPYFDVFLVSEVNDSARMVALNKEDFTEFLKHLYVKFPERSQLRGYGLDLETEDGVHAGTLEF